ncbi:MAG: hypothetical protein WBD40_14440 [Tepidisphaeraceae bacterium]
MRKRKDINVYPPGLNAKKVAATIAYYDARRNSDLAHDPDHELISEATAWVEVPIALVPQVRKLISRRRKSA